MHLSCLDICVLSIVAFWLIKLMKMHYSINNVWTTRLNYVPFMSPLFSDFVFTCLEKIFLTDLWHVQYKTLLQTCVSGFSPVTEMYSSWPSLFWDAGCGPWATQLCVPLAPFWKLALIRLCQKTPVPAEHHANETSRLQCSRWPLADLYFTAAHCWRVYCVPETSQETWFIGLHCGNRCFRVFGSIPNQCYYSKLNLDPNYYISVISYGQLSNSTLEFQDCLDSCKCVLYFRVDYFTFQTRPSLNTSYTICAKC